MPLRELLLCLRANSIESFVKLFKLGYQLNSAEIQIFLKPLGLNCCPSPGLSLAG